MKAMSGTVNLDGTLRRAEYAFAAAEQGVVRLVASTVLDRPSSASPTSECARTDAS